MSKKGNFILAAIIGLLMALPLSSANAQNSGKAQWARTVSTVPDNSSFLSRAVDASGNIYAAGHITGTVTYDFGNGVAAAGTFDKFNAMLVTYSN
jgi:hypothetical protein